MALKRRIGAPNLVRDFRFLCNAAIDRAFQRCSLLSLALRARARPGRNCFCGDELAGDRTISLTGCYPLVIGLGTRRQRKTEMNTG